MTLTVRDAAELSKLLALGPFGWRYELLCNPRDSDVTIVQRQDDSLTGPYWAKLEMN